MSFRKRIIGRIRKVTERFSGEYSEPAPENLEAYERPGTPNENAEVVMARLNRSKGGAKKAD